MIFFENKSESRYIETEIFKNTILERFKQLIMTAPIGDLILNKIETRLNTINYFKVRPSENKVFIFIPTPKRREIFVRKSK